MTPARSETHVHHFRIDVPRLLAEVTNNSLLPNSGVLKIPLNIFRQYLIKLADYAVKLNDPELNIIMLEMGLYELTPSEIVQAIEEQKALIKKS